MKGRVQEGENKWEGEKGKITGRKRRGEERGEGKTWERKEGKGNDQNNERGKGGKEYGREGI